ncbi:hypothetical protein GCM10027428_05730 [Haliea atlantica]
MKEQIGTEGGVARLGGGGTVGDKDVAVEPQGRVYCVSRHRPTGSHRPESDRSPVLMGGRGEGQQELFREKRRWI